MSEYPPLFYRRTTLADVRQYFETVFNRPSTPPLLRYRRKPSSSRYSVTGDSDIGIVSDTELSKPTPTVSYVTRSCRNSPTAPGRLGRTVIETKPLLNKTLSPSWTSESDINMSDKEGQKEPNNMKKNKETKEDKDPVSQKSLRQPTLSLTGTIQKKGRLGQLTDAMVNSMPIPSSTNNAAPAATSTPLTTGATWESNTNFQAEKSLSNISLAYTCSDGNGLQDDSMIRGGSPGKQPPNLQLAHTTTANIVIQGVGADETYQATLQDPPHFSQLPGTWQEAEAEELLRIQAARATSQASSKTSSGQHSEKSTEGPPTPNTLQKRKSKKNHKKPGENGGSSSSSSNAMDDQETVKRRPVSNLHMRIQEMEKHMASMQQQLHTVSSTNNLISQGVVAVDGRTQWCEKKIGELQTHADKTNQHLHEMNSRVNHTLNTVTALATAVAEDRDKARTNHQDMIKLIQNAQSRGSATGEAKEADTCETGLFISGIQELRAFFGLPEDMDPTRVAGKLMDVVGSYYAIHRIYIADRSVDNSTRKNAKAVIIYLTSVYHKKETVIRIKKLLEEHRVARVAVNDCYPLSETPKALALNRLAYEKRQDKSMTRTRVINKKGQAVLQASASRGQPYKDVQVSEETLRPYLQDNRNKGDNNKRPNNNVGQSKEYRDRRNQAEATGMPPPLAQRDSRQRNPPRLSTPNNQPVGRKEPVVKMPRGTGAPDGQAHPLHSQNYPQHQQQQFQQHQQHQGASYQQQGNQYFQQHYQHQQISAPDGQIFNPMENQMSGQQWPILQNIQNVPLHQVNNQVPTRYMAMPEGIASFVTTAMQGGGQQQQQYPSHQNGLVYTQNTASNNTLHRQDD